VKKRIIFLRHAQTEYDGPSDRSRELTEKGLSDSRKMGVYLKKNYPEVKAIYTSVAHRAHTTGKLINEALKLSDEDFHSSEALYYTTPNDLLHYINQEFEDKYDTVLLINHNPIIPHLVEQLVGHIFPNFHVCSAVILDFELDTWKAISPGTGIFVEHLDSRVLFPD